MAVLGKYVSRFAEASHAIPEGMHMNADYPFMLPRILAITASHVTLQGRGQKETVAIHRGKDGQEWCELAQISTFEQLYNRPPQRFRFWPFKDEDTAAIGEAPPLEVPSAPQDAQAHLFPPPGGARWK